MKIFSEAYCLSVALLVAVFSQPVLGQNAASPPPGYFDIPAGFDFPADKRLLEQYRSQPSIAAQRIHAWNLLGGLTRPTPDGKFSIFETWFSEDETFASGVSNLRGRGSSMPTPRFSVPRQFGASRGTNDAAAPAAPGSAVLSFVLYNFAGYNHVRTNRLFQASALDNLVKNGAFDVKIPQSRTIPPFPSNAVVLKTVWWPVAKDKVSAMPIWDPEANPPQAAGNPLPTWSRFIGVDATRPVPAGETGDITFDGQTKRNSHIVGIGGFHARVLEDRDVVDAVNNQTLLAQVAQSSFGRPLAVGDFAVLVALHVTTKEIDDWVWATYWWHDRPSDGPFAQNRVGAISGVWRNYLMDVAYDLNLPAERDGSPHVTFDPWLEARFSDGGHGGGGVVSNCMNCHNRASWPNRPAASCPNNRCFLPIYRGNPDFEDPAYASGRLRTDFLWSIPDLAN
jgi:hypothetical protein